MTLLSTETREDRFDDGAPQVKGNRHVSADQTRIANGYRLELAGTITMDLLTTDKTDEWVRRVASVMSLRTMPREETARIEKRIRVSERPARRYGALTLRSDGNGSHLVSGVGGEMHVVLTVRDVWQSFYPFYERLIRLGGFPLHAALVEHNGRRVLISAAAGTGKSTCCSRFPAGWDERQPKGRVDCLRGGRG